MGSVQVVLRKKPNAQGKYPLAIRITKNQKSSFIHTGQYVGQEHWDNFQHKVKRPHPNSKMINHFLLKKLAEANEKLLQSEISKNNESLKKIR